MAKQGEIDYLKNIGEAGRIHAFEKPFSDSECGLYLRDMGSIFSLLPRPPARLLDLGAGSGWTSVFFAKRGYDVVGQDISPDMIQMANENQKLSGLKNLNFVNCDYEDMNFTDEFDAAIFYDSLHHSMDENKTLSSVYKALKPGGICITIEPGIGHAESHGSQNAINQFGVTEKDMPPRLIINVGKDVGFTEFKIYSRYTNPVEIIKVSFTVKIKNLLRAIKALIIPKRPTIDLNSNVVVLKK